MTAPIDRAFLRALARHPRFTGSEALATARGVCAEQLRALGYSLREQPFTFSTLPARFGMPAIGALTIALVGGAWWLDRAAHPGPAVAAMLAGALVTAALARWLTGRRASVLPWGEASGVNLEATLGDGSPRVWLMAHLDSKSQPLSLALRAFAVTLTIVAWISGVAIAGARLLGFGAMPFGIAFALAIAGGLPLLMASIGARSPGAVDNASGVASVVAAARALKAPGAVGIVLTDAEEAGLAGAHAWVRTRTPAIALNCDTVDDEGGVRVLWSVSRPETVCAAVRRAAEATSTRCELRRLPRGILTDGVALQRAGWACVTVSKVTWRTLRRIHTTRDSVENLAGTGISEVANLLAATARELA